MMKLPLWTQHFTLLGLLLFQVSAVGQSVRMNNDTQNLTALQSRWSTFVTYSFASDYADNRQPRAYTHSLMGSVAYRFLPNWSTAFDAGILAETVAGRIEKNQQETYTETLNPSTAVNLTYDNRFWKNDTFTLFTHAEPLWSEPNRREGYKGLIGAGGSVSIGFFNRRWTVAQTVDATSLLNTYSYATDTTSNPDYFVTYRMINTLRFLGSWRASHVFGLRTTRYMDGFIGYSYSSSLIVSKAWQNVSLAATYDNGGFTEKGVVQFWFIDEYRRIGRLILNYSF